MLDDLVRNARGLWRAEGLIAEIRLRSHATRSALAVGAGLVGLFAVGMFDLAGFFLFEPSLGAAGSAALVGLIDVAVAGLMLFAASRAAPGRELDLALELRQTAIDGLEADLRAVQDELAALRGELKGLRDVASAVIRHPLDAALPALIVPLAGILLKSLRRSSPTAGGDAPEP